MTIFTVYKYQPESPDKGSMTCHILFLYPDRKIYMVIKQSPHIVRSKPELILISQWCHEVKSQSVILCHNFDFSLWCRGDVTFRLIMWAHISKAHIDITVISQHEVRIWYLCCIMMTSFNEVVISQVEVSRFWPTHNEAFEQIDA